MLESRSGKALTAEVPLHNSVVATARKMAYTVVLEEDPRGHWHAMLPLWRGALGVVAPVGTGS